MAKFRDVRVSLSLSAKCAILDSTHALHCSTLQSEEDLYVGVHIYLAILCILTNIYMLGGIMA